MSKPLRMGSLCTGVGGIDLAWLRLGQRVAFQAEIEPFCCEVLASRPEFEGVPNLGDITKLHGHECPAVDILAGGIPCQPWSEAGQQQGKYDERHLWPAMRRIIGDPETGLGLWPTWVLIENVAGFARLALDDVCTDLEHLGYEVTAYMVPAAAVEAPHLRERVFVVAHASEHGRRRYSQPRPLRRDVQPDRAPRLDTDRCDTPLADTRHPQRTGRYKTTSRSTRSNDARVLSCHEPASSCRGVGQADTAGTRPQGQERAQSPIRRDVERQSGEAVAHPQRIGRQWGASEQGGNVLHWQADRRQQGQRDAGDGHAHDGRSGQAQPRMGGAADGLSRWLDGHRWPAGPTEAQHEWEAPRTITGSVANRAHRLKALGNAVVPAQVAPILAAIVEAHWQYAEVEA